MGRSPIKRLVAAVARRVHLRKIPLNVKSGADAALLLIKLESLEYRRVTRRHDSLLMGVWEYLAHRVCDAVRAVGASTGGA